MTEPTQRRNLRFETLDQIAADVRNLKSRGYKALGKWDLAQICLHLSDWMTFPVQGFPKQALPIRAILWLMKVTIGKSALAKILASGTMGANQPTMRETIPASGQDLDQAIGKLEKAIKGFQNHQGEFHPSPLFGAMDRDTCLRLQRIHSAHHLSFLIPN